MHIQDHVNKVLRIRSLIIEALFGTVARNQDGPFEKEEEIYIASLVQSVVISLQTELVSNEIGNLDRPDSR